MKAIRMWASLALMISCAAITSSDRAAAGAVTHTTQQKTERARVAFAHDLPKLNGGKLAVTIVDVSYGPGESSMPHSHPCPVIGYVLEGTIRTQVKGEPEAIYKGGESFYEPPNGVHLVSANASDKERAELLAYFICDHHAALSVDVPAGGPAEEK
ncbi:MAG: cupin domain-containing protein [Candidatus Acidiferrales bacterium]|jgi:quercetin dioxygenase-like cupin family protein